MTQEHAFAPFIRILGKGKKGTRSLTREEAKQAMGMILDDKVHPEQLGAFLMLMRVKEEEAEELAGFADAVLERTESLSVPVDLDWATYAGKRRRHPWYVVAALALANSGVRILMHGSRGHTPGRIYAEDVIEALGGKGAQDWSDAEQQLNKTNFSYLPVSVISPVLDRLIELRPILGLRSPVHTLCRMLNPLHARCSIDGVFHPPYGPKHQQTAHLLGTARNLTLKGDGGEAEARPDSESWALWMLDGQLSEQQWPRILEKRVVRDEEMSLDTLVAVWRGEQDHEYGVAAIISTIAITLKLLGKGEEPQALFEQAKGIWEQRNKQLYR